MVTGDAAAARRGAAVDEENIRRELDEAGLTAWRPWVRGEASRFVNEHWQEIEVVARELQQRTTLDAHEVAAIVATFGTNREDAMSVIRLDEPKRDHTLDLGTARAQTRADVERLPGLPDLERDVRAALGPGARATQVRAHVDALCGERAAFRTEYLRLLKAERLDAEDKQPKESEKARERMLADYERAGRDPLSAQRAEREATGANTERFDEREAYAAAVRRRRAEEDERLWRSPLSANREIP
jgi:hypothetical protein